MAEPIHETSAEVEGQSDDGSSSPRGWESESAESGNGQPADEACVDQTGGVDFSGEELGAEDDVEEEDELKREQEAETKRLVGLLEEYRLSSLSETLQDHGFTSVSRLRAMTDASVGELQLKKINEKKLSQLLEQLKLDPIHAAVQQGLVLDYDNINKPFPGDEFSSLPLVRTARGGSAAEACLLLQANATLEAADEDGDTALAAACGGGHVGVVALLLEAGANVHTRNHDGQTAAFAAGGSGSVECLTLLSKYKAPFNIADFEDRSPSFAAAQNGHVAALQWLEARREAHGSFEYEDTQGTFTAAARGGHVTCLEHLMKRCEHHAPPRELSDGPRDWSMWVTMTWAAAAAGRAEVLQWLIDSDLLSDLRMTTAEHRDCSPLWVAAFRGHLECCKLLVAAGHICEDDAAGMSPLHAAARAGALACVEWLVGQASGDMDSPDTVYKQTPAWGAAEGGHVSVLQFLASKGADLHASDVDGKTVLFTAAENNRLDCLQWLITQCPTDINTPCTQRGCPPVWVAALHGHLECCQTLVGAGARLDLRASKYNQSVAFAAVAGGHMDVLRWLSSQGVSPLESDPDGLTTAHVAANEGHAAVLRYLVELRADVSALDKESTGPTMLMAAAAAGSEECVQILLDAGADPTKTDAEGRTAAHYALDAEKREIAAALEGRTGTALRPDTQAAQ